MKTVFIVQYDAGKFFTDCFDDNSDRYCQETTDFTAIDKLANGFIYCMWIKNKGQKKFRSISVTTHSIYAMLDYVKAEFANDAFARIQVFTPDVEINFYC